MGLQFHSKHLVGNINFYSQATMNPLIAVFGFAACALAKPEAEAQMPGQMMPGQMMPGQMFGQMPGQMNGQMMPGQMFGQMPGQMNGQQMQGRMPGQMQGQMMPGQQMQGRMPGQMMQGQMMHGQQQMQGQMPFFQGHHDGAHQSNRLVTHPASGAVVPEDTFAVKAAKAQHFDAKDQHYAAKDMAFAQQAQQFFATKLPIPSNSRDPMPLPHS